MKLLERIFLVLICAVAIVAIAGASEFFTATINKQSFLILVVVAAVAFVFRKQATNFFIKYKIFPTEKNHHLNS